VRTAVQKEDSDGHPDRQASNRGTSGTVRALGSPCLRREGKRLHARRGESGGAGARAAAAAGAFDGLIEELSDHIAERLEDRLAACLEAREARPALLDRRGLAEALACGVDTIDRLRSEGMPELRVGDAPRFDLDGQVLPWLRERGTE